MPVAGRVLRVRSANERRHFVERRAVLLQPVRADGRRHDEDLVLGVRDEDLALVRRPVGRARHDARVQRGLPGRLQAAAARRTTR